MLRSAEVGIICTCVDLDLKPSLPKTVREVTYLHFMKLEFHYHVNSNF